MVDPRSRVTVSGKQHMEEDATWLTKHLASSVFHRGRSLSSPQLYPCPSEHWLAFSVSMLDRPGSVIWFLLVRRTQYKWVAASEQGTHNLTVIIRWNENYSHSINMISSMSFYSLHVAPREATVLIPTVLDLTVWHVATAQCGAVGVEILEFLPTPPMGPPLYGDTEFKHSAKKRASDWTFLDSSPVLVKLFPNMSATVIFQEIQEQKLNGIHPMKTVFFVQ